MTDTFQAHLGAVKAKVFSSSSKKKSNKANSMAPSSRVTKALGEVLVATLKRFQKGRQ
jgi:hypothetical protein